MKSPQLLTNKKIETLYHILKIKSDSSSKQIKKAFHKLCLKFHPDRNKKSHNHNKFIRIQKAYYILKDPKVRVEYDQFLQRLYFKAKETLKSCFMEYNYMIQKKYVYGL